MRMRHLAATTALCAGALALAACGDDVEQAEMEMEETAAEMEAEADMAADEMEEEMDMAEAEEPAGGPGAGPGGPGGGMPAMPSMIAYDAIGDTGESIEVTPDVLDPEDGEIAERHSSYGDNVAPAVSWTPVDGAESYALIMQDPVDFGGGPMVVLHWVVYNIPGDVTSLPEGIEPGAEIPGVPGAMQANNISGQMGYAGPRPPGGRPPHQYTFQVFALDTTLDVPQDVDYASLLDAMEGHVIGGGSTVTPYSPPDDAPAMGAPPPQ